MSQIEKAILDLGALDCLARQRTAIHGIDPRAKVAVCLVFIATVASFDKYDVAALAPFAVYPAALMAAGGVPISLIGRFLVYACPFAILVGAFNPLFDRQIMLELGGVAVSGGWVSFFSIICRFLLAFSAALILVATTGLNAICASLTRLGLPRVLTALMVMLYRYIFLLGQEANRMKRAHDLRAVNDQGVDLRTYGSLASLLLLRAYARGERIHAAMLCRGFDGEMPMTAISRFSIGSAIFLIAWLAYFAAMRFLPLPRHLGEAFLEAAR